MKVNLSINLSDFPKTHALAEILSNKTVGAYKQICAIADPVQIGEDLLDRVGVSLDDLPTLLAQQGGAQASLREEFVREVLCAMNQGTGPFSVVDLEFPLPVGEHEHIRSEWAKHLGAAFYLYTLLVVAVYRRGDCETTAAMKRIMTSLRDVERNDAIRVAVVYADKFYKDEYNNVFEGLLKKFKLVASGKTMQQMAKASRGGDDDRNGNHNRSN